MSKHSVSQHDLFVNPTYVLVHERPSPLAAAEKVKRDYSARLDRLLSEFERELTVALNVDSLSPTYQLAELAGYLSRAGQVLRRHEQLATDRAAQAELAERGQAWVNATPTKTN
jgi:hypothetical protein